MSALPELTDDNRFFWTSGADGRLRLLRCGACAGWVHPPGPICPACLGRDLAPQPVSGLATVEAVTVNHQAWTPDLAVPQAIARVVLDEHPGLRLTTRIVGCPPAEVAIGRRVRVRFEQHEDVWLPLFEPLD